MELTVACVLRSGGVYTPEWVSKLRNGVAANLSAPHRFVALSDVPVDCERIQLAHGWPRWWPKIELFRLPGPVLFFDLDTLITGPLDDIAAVVAAHDMIALRNFYRLERIGGGMLAWRGDVGRLYDTFAADPERWMRECANGGDQAFLDKAAGNLAFWQDIVPGQVVSYKAQKCAAALPRNARVMCLHGLPKFRDMPADSWARKAWEGL